jgi:hypothetical protein
MRYATKTSLLISSRKEKIGSSAYLASTSMRRRLLPAKRTQKPRTKGPHRVSLLLARFMPSRNATIVVASRIAPRKSMFRNFDALDLDLGISAGVGLVSMPSGTLHRASKTANSARGA